MAQTYPEQIALGCDNFDEVLEKLDFRPYDMMMNRLDESIEVIEEETGFW